MKTRLHLLLAATTLACVSLANRAQAHCDTLNGPVVAAARTALEAADVTSTLRWVRSEDEAAIRAAFERTMQVRKQSPEARQLADQWFFETLVRLHRAGEGEPYTGLKSGKDLTTDVLVADRALGSGSVQELASDATTAMRTTLNAKFEQALRLRAHADQSVAAGRAYVAAYVDYIHFVERLLELSATRHAAPHAH